MADLRIPAECSIKIENKKLRYSIYSLELSQQIDAHHVLKVELRPLAEKSYSESEFIDSGQYTPFLGKPVSVELKPKGGLVDPGLILKFVGVVTETRIQNNLGEINQIFLTAKSPTYFMDMAPKNCFYSEKSLSDVSNSILSRYPVDRGVMDIPSSIKYKFCVQYRETDYQFLKRLAEEEGLWAYYDGTRFCVAARQGDETVKLFWRDTLGSFGLNLSCQQQFFQHKVYNYQEKETYSQRTKSVSSSSNPSGIFKVPLDVSEDVLRENGVLDFPKKVADAKQLDEYLSIKKSESREKLVFGAGKSTVPLLSVGKKAKIENMMEDIVGQYFVIEVIHHFDHSGNYYNEFKCVPVDLAYPKKKTSRPPIEGLHSGVVTANDDPDHLGRVKVRFQWNEEGEESPWIRVLTTHAGKDRGLFCLPEIGDEVLVSFDQDYPETPMVVGSLFNKVDAPVDETRSSDNEIKSFITKGGNRVVIKDTAEKEEILITTKEGKNQLSLKMGSPPQVSVHSEGKIEMDADEIILKAKKKLFCSSDGKAELNARTDMKIKGQSTELTGQTGVKVQGQTVELSGQTSLKMQGGMAEFSGQSMVVIKGGLVRIN